MTRCVGNFLNYLVEINLKNKQKVTKGKLLSCTRLARVAIKFFRLKTFSLTLTSAAFSYILDGYIRNVCNIFLRMKICSIHFARDFYF